MNDFLLFSKRVFICLTLCSTIYSCNKENIEEEMLLGSSTNPSPETTSTSKNYDIFDAMGFKGGMALIYTDWTNASVPYVSYYMHNNESKDSKDYPRPKQTSNHKLISSNDGGSSTGRSRLCLWGDYLFSFTPYLKQEKMNNGTYQNVYYLGTSSVRVTESGLLSSVSTGKMSASIPGLGNFNEFSSIAVAQFTDRMYAVVGTPDGMALLRTKSDKPAESLSWEFVDWVSGKSDYNLTIYDMEVGIVEDKATGTFSESIYVGCVKGEYGIVLEQYTSQGNWRHHEFSSNIRVKSDSKASFAMQQGAFADLANSAEFCIQIIRSRESTVASTVFYPSSNSFGASCNLKDHNGYLATATTVTPIYENKKSDIPAGYQQHIYVFQGSHSDDMDIDRYLSNRIYAQVTNSSNTTKALGESIDDYLNDPELRKLCALVGIIEGPPPTAVHLDEDFSNLAKLGMVPTTLKFGHKEDSYTTENYTIGGGISGEVGLYHDNPAAKTLKKLAISIGGYFSANYTCTTERHNSKTIDYSIDATYESRQYARLLYVVPTYELHEYFYTDNNGNNIFSAPIMAIMNANQMTYYYKPLPLNEAPFNISDVSILSNWKNRMASTVTEGSRAFISTAYIYGGGATIEQTLQKGFSKKTGYVIRDQTSINVELVAKLFRGQGSIFGEFSIDNSWSTSVNDQLAVKFQQMDKNDIIDRHSVVGYTCVTYIMFENCADVTKYYQELERKNLKLPDEKPWIIGYEVTEIETE